MSCCWYESTDSSIERLTGGCAGLAAHAACWLGAGGAKRLALAGGAHVGLGGSEVGAAHASGEATAGEPKAGMLSMAPLHAAVAAASASAAPAGVPSGSIGPATSADSCGERVRARRQDSAAARAAACADDAAASAASAAAAAAASASAFAGTAAADAVDAVLQCRLRCCHHCDGASRWRRRRRRAAAASADSAAFARAGWARRWARGQERLRRPAEAAAAAC
eukprot:4840275-Pleurochrysis_carterae.AAC.5